MGEFFVYQNYYSMPITGVTINTDKREYAQGEIVEITFTNSALLKNKWIHYPFYTVEHFENNYWREIKNSPCPSPLEGAPARDMIVEARKSPQKVMWLQIEEWCPTSLIRQVPPGRYRVKAGVSNSKNKTGRVIYSDEFYVHANPDKELYISNPQPLQNQQTDEKESEQQAVRDVSDI